MATVFFACSDDDKEETYSPLAAEQNKENLETAGVNTIEKLNGLVDLSALKTLKEWNSLCMSSDPEDSRNLAPINEVIEPITKITKDAPVLTGELPQLNNLVVRYKDLKGTYTYSKTTSEWIYTESEGVIFIFPTENSTTNNATLSLSDFAYTNPDDAEASLPTAVLINLTVDNKEIMKLTITSSYDSEGLPTKISESLDMDDYNYTTIVTRSNSNFTYLQALSFKGSRIIEIRINEEGDLSYENLLNLPNTTIDKQTILSSANVSITIDNIQIIGILNWDKIKEYLPFKSFESEEEAIAALAELNKNARLYIKYQESNEIFAEIEFYSTTDEEAEVPDYRLNYRIKFSDKSYFDASYFDEGFDTFANNMNTWLDNMDDSYYPRR